MAEPRRERRNSNSQLLQELDVLSQTLYQGQSNRRAASLALPRSAAPTVTPNPASATNSPRPRRLSMSPFGSRDDQTTDEQQPTSKNQHLISPIAAETEVKKGIWGWRPIRALAHITMQKVGCLFSVEVVAIQGLPTTMNGLRLSVSVRKKESRDGAMQTMPARVLQGAADFEETLFVRCHVYFSGKPPKFEPRPFLISAVAIDAPELDFGRSSVDLSLMVKESMERVSEGERVRQWDTVFPLGGKAKGGEIVVKLGFQIMEDGGVEIFKQGEGSKASKSNKGGLSSSARRQSKSAFSVPSPKVTRSEPAMTPTQRLSSMDLRGIDDFKLDEPESLPPPPPPPPTTTTSSSELVQKPAEEQRQEDLDLPEFEVIDKGVEIQQEEKEEKEDEEEEEADAEAESAADEASVSSEVVKEVVHDSAHLTRLTELDAIAQQIKALESMVAGDGTDPSDKIDEDKENQRLDDEEALVTKEFLQMLELEDGKEFSFDMSDVAISMKPEAGEAADGELRCFLSDLGKGLGSVVQTRDGGYLASMNPFDVEVARKETPKLAMQISKPIILKDQGLGSGVEVFQKLAAMGSEELSGKLVSLASMDELMGKTAEQIAFEGIASSVISGRTKQGASSSSSAAQSVAALKEMCAAMSDGRKERILTGIWNVKEAPVTVEGILPFSLQKIEAMAVEALKIQAEMADDNAPFDVSSLTGHDSPLNSTVSPEDWVKSCLSSNVLTMLVLIQLRDPLRRYEAVGAPAVALVQAAKVEDGSGDNEEGKFKVTSMHLGGLKLRSGAKKTVWDGEKQRLTAIQWLVAYGLGKAGKKSKGVKVKGGPDLVWSISSRVMADMWLKAMRNPDVKFPEKF